MTSVPPCTLVGAYVHRVGPRPSSFFSKRLAGIFGSLRQWWFAQHRTPRIDLNGHVWFANDQIAYRCLEEIDFDYNALDATAVLLTAPA